MSGQLSSTSLPTPPARIRWARIVGGALLLEVLLVALLTPIGLVFGSPFLEGSTDTTVFLVAVPTGCFVFAAIVSGWLFRQRHLSRCLTRWTARCRRNHALPSAMPRRSRGRAGRDCRLRNAALLGNPGTPNHRRSRRPRVSTGKASDQCFVAMRYNRLAVAR